jgi:hypothetical protein
MADKIIVYIVVHIPSPGSLIVVSMDESLHLGLAWVCGRRWAVDFIQ